MRLCWIFFLRLLGWKIKGSFPEDLKKAIVIVAPHTSNWDFIVGLAVRSSLKLYRFRFLGKHSLFKKPWGFFFTRLGGIPVDRSDKHDMVNQVVNLFNRNENFILALSPEGTRKKVERLKTGFYHIAKKAAVPIMMIGMDYAKKEISFAEPFYPTEDMEADMRHIIQHFSGMAGKNPSQGLGDLY